ncbi:FAD-binding protein, partial [Tardiphaga sp.]|uniref:FAD-binding protein n=1 Tax=Tardiphaga sp. TaxID=1926292 RepID=UPI0026283216
VSKTLRGAVTRRKGIRKAGDLVIVDLVRDGGEITGAVAWHISTGATVTIAAKATIVATGGLTRLYRRNSASANMGGDGYALALRAGAELIDMEFVQFFPIGHLAPRLVGMDPIMWDPFRYKLGGKLLNSEMREFEEDYATRDTRSDGKYVLTRDLATYAITKEVEAGRGSPAGGAFLSFQHVPAAEIRAAFGSVVDRLAGNGIDLAKQPVEVAPMAHYHMGGIRVDETLQTRVPGLYACGEAVGGANGANRLSGNAITEAFVFGARAGRNAAQRAATVSLQWSEEAARPALDLLRSAAKRDAPNPAAVVVQLQAVMADDVGPFRTDGKLRAAIASIEQLKQDIGDTPVSSEAAFDSVLVGWLDLRNALLVAQSVAVPALARTESRGAHQRDDHLSLDDEAWCVNQIVDLSDGAIHLRKVAPTTGKAAL